MLQLVLLWGKQLSTGGFHNIDWFNPATSVCISEFQVWMFGYHGSLVGSEKLSMSGFTFHFFFYTSIVRFIIYNDQTNSAFTFIPRHLNNRKTMHVQRLNPSDVKQYSLECMSVEYQKYGRRVHASEADC